MPDHASIYQRQAARYQQLIDREDYRGNLPSALQAIASFVDQDLVDLGAGTGRLSCMFAKQVRSLIALDLNEHMLQTAAQKLHRQGASWLTAAADHRELPLPAGCADVVTSGWSFSYLKTWSEGSWKQAVISGLAEIARILRPGGKLILIETLGTGRTTPRAPAELRAYYDTLAEQGFRSLWIRTDYRFKNRQEAEELSGFFFGRQVLSALSEEEQPVLPECTGIWWR
jgi:ubiquinone/menaquinone biosynthesis C-methylase UbiE